MRVCPVSALPGMLKSMARIHLQAADDHVAALAHERDPVKAVAELVWNALDADAKNVQVTLRRNAADGIDGVSVTDDGHGISPEEAKSDFKWIGGSWKRRTRKSKGLGRPLHGHAGQGRLRAFALGTAVKWTTTAVDTAGKTMRCVIRADSSSRQDVEISEPIEVDDETGTVFEASGREGIDRLESDETRARITSFFAPYLIAHQDIEFIYDGSQIDPAENVESDVTYPINWTHNEIGYEAELRVIEWKEGGERAIYLCDADGLPVDDLDQAPATDFRYSAYALWAEMPEHRNEWILASLEPQQSLVGGLVAAVSSKLEAIFEERRAAKRRELVEEWVQRQTYPYAGEPQTPEERVERATFDVVATSIRQHIPKAKKQQRLTLGLLKESLQQRPSDVGELLDQFLGLPTEERAQLDRLLRRTSLSRVIQASTSVANRLEFIAALELMVFDPQAANLVKEREHLHRILENELWVFGEEFNLMISERGLSAALDRHLEILGEARADKAVVRRLDGTTGRLDLLLSAAAVEHDRNRHLVIELKAPKVPATLEELAQIKSYAMAVVADPRFAASNTVWDFWLVTSSIDPAVRQEANQRGRPRGLVFEPDMPEAPDAKVRVWVRDWGQIIEDARRRLDYFQREFQHNPSLEDARQYLTLNHGNVIPRDLVAADDMTADAPEQSPDHES